MLIEFSIENFLSFKERNTFSMIASSDNVLEDNLIKLKNQNLLKTTAIYGANASGKTNLFKALAYIVNMITLSNSLDPNALLPIIPFKLDKETMKKPSFFEIRFLVDNVKYVYKFKANDKNVYEESLYFYPGTQPKKIFKRENINKYSFDRDDEKKLKPLETRNTSNKFFLATATNWNYEKTKPAYDFITRNLAVIFDMEPLKNYTYNMYSNDSKKELENFAIEVLEKVDLNIKGYKLVEEKLTEEKLNSFLLPDSIKAMLPIGSIGYKVITKHIVDNEEFYFDMNEESMGTQIIFSLIPFIRDVLINNKVLIIDELDKSLHPIIVNYIIEIFNDPVLNKKGAQLIFNTHDTNLLDLDLMRRDQIWFTEKNDKDGSSDIYPLDDFSVRKNENIEKGYLLGRYGAIPFLGTNTIVLDN